MAHTHYDPHDHGEVVEHGAPYTSGLVIALVTLLVSPSSRSRSCTRDPGAAARTTRTATPASRTTAAETAALRAAAELPAIPAVVDSSRSFPQYTLRERALAGSALSAVSVVLTASAIT